MAINAISVSTLLNTLQIPDVDDVIKVGYGRCKISFKNATAANQFYNKKYKYEKLHQYPYVANIFAQCLTKVGIIFDVRTEISEQELLKEIISPVPILEVIRVMRKDEDRIPTKSVKLIFEGLNIHSEIVYMYTKIKVKYFIPFAQCYRCFRFNHFAQLCKNKDSLCPLCGEAHDRKVDCTKKFCKNCEGEHEATFKDCPARIKAHTIKKITIESLHFKEARMKYTNLFGNRFEILDDEESNFPTLPGTQQRKKPNNTVEAAKTMHKRLPLSKVVRTNVNKQREQKKDEETMSEWRETNREHNYEVQHKELAYPKELMEQLQKQDELVTKINQAISSLITSNSAITANKQHFELLTSIQESLRQMYSRADALRINFNLP